MVRVENTATERRNHSRGVAQGHLFKTRLYKKSLVTTDLAPFNCMPVEHSQAPSCVRLSK
jgi:hypothetical protein